MKILNTIFIKIILYNFTLNQLNLLILAKNYDIKIDKNNSNNNNNKSYKTRKLELIWDHNSIKKEIDCDKHGNCKRLDGTSLQPGSMFKTLKLNKTMEYSYTNIVIGSIDPFHNSVFLTYLAKSEKYVCAGGFSECNWSCCYNGYCKEAANTCENIKNTKTRAIYLGTLIIFAFLLIGYWLVFICIGLNYAKKGNSIITNSSDNKGKDLKIVIKTSSSNHMNVYSSEKQLIKNVEIKDSTNIYNVDDGLNNLGNFNDPFNDKKDINNKYENNIDNFNQNINEMENIDKNQVLYNTNKTR